MSPVTKRKTFVTQLDVRFGDPTYDEMMIGYYDFAPVGRKTIKLDPSLFDDYAGEYAIGPGATFTVTREGDRLMFSAPGQPKIEAFPESELKFFFTVVDAQATFIKGEDGKAYRGVRQQFVKLGAARGDQVAVLSGVKPGDEVVTSGLFKLRNGAAVQINNKVQPANSPAPRPENS